MSVCYSLSWPLALLVLLVAVLAGALGWMVRAEVGRRKEKSDE